MSVGVVTCSVEQKSSNDLLEKLSVPEVGPDRIPVEGVFDLTASFGILHATLDIFRDFFLAVEDLQPPAFPHPFDLVFEPSLHRQRLWC